VAILRAPYDQALLERSRDRGLVKGFDQRRLDRDWTVVTPLLGSETGCTCGRAATKFSDLVHTRGDGVLGLIGSFRVVFCQSTQSGANQGRPDLRLVELG
jgi:hypothetical protein